MRLVLGNLVVVLAALGLSEVIIWHFATGRGWGSLTLLGGVVAAYSLDNLLDAPVNQRAKVAARFGPALLAGGALVLLGLWHVPAHWPLIATLGLLAGMYVPLKRTIPKGVITATGWAMAIVWLPCSRILTVQEGLPLAGCVFLIVAANAILCDALDVDDDRIKGIRGIGPWLGARRASRIASVLAAVGAVLAFSLGVWPFAAAAIPLAIAGLLPPTTSHKERRRTTLDLLLLLPGIVVLALAAR